MSSRRLIVAPVLLKASSAVTVNVTGWFAVANPQIPSITGDRYFDTNQTGVIFYTTTVRLQLDTSTCSLPNNSVLSTGK